MNIGLKYTAILGLFTLQLFALACGQSSLKKAAYVALAEKWITHLATLHTPMGEPEFSDWLDMYDEPGQTFPQYVASRPNRPDSLRNKIYVVTLGDVTPKQQEILDLSSEYLGIFYNIEIAQLPPLSLDQVPDTARREGWDSDQFLTPYILYEMLAPRLPDDAYALLAFTAEDLYPQDDWAFVFGQAALRARVGVWSLHRYGDPSKGPAQFQLALLRTLSTSSHETGHMYGMHHCIRFECAMNGSNSLTESVRRPGYFCPQCDSVLEYPPGSGQAVSTLSGVLGGTGRGGDQGLLFTSG